MSECRRGHVQNWADKKFGCGRCGMRQGPGFAFSHTLKNDGKDYREDLARFPNDPEAYVNGKADVQKLLDKRKRQGWVESEFKMESDHKPPTPEENVQTAYERAKAKNFKLDGEE